MGRKQVWKTLWLDLQDVHLWKSQGMIPYHMYKEYNMKAGVVAYPNEDYPSAEKIEGIDVECICPKYGETIDSCLYMLRNARKIDYLYTYHIKWKALMPILVFRILNPRGRVWLDLDWNLNWAESYNALKEGNAWERVQFWMQKFIMQRCCTLITSSASACCRRFSKIYGIRNKVKYVPRGSELIECDYKSKENIILTVGRLGTKQKNTELLVRAFINTRNQQNWKLVLIGSAEKKFLNYLEKNIAEYHLEDRIQYLGNITDRLELSKWYAKAKIFALSSRFEGFPLVYAEALLQGDYLLGSDVLTCTEDIIGEKEFVGRTFRNNKVSSLENCILKTVESPYLEEEHVIVRREYAIRNFTYSEILKKISGHLLRSGQSEERKSTKK